MERLVEQLESGLVEHSEASSQWTGIKASLQKADLTTWSEVERAMCLYLLLKLQSFGLYVPKSLIHRFLQEPGSREALVWWEKAQTYLGVSSPH